MGREKNGTDFSQKNYKWTKKYMKKVFNMVNHKEMKLKLHCKSTLPGMVGYNQENHRGSKMAGRRQNQNS
jgi:hypothetical protein